MNVVLYDTSLRDGTQGEDVQLSVADKLTITQLIDELGISYIEGGYPGSNPRDEQFFAEARSLKLKHAKLTAFGATRRSGINCEQDGNLQALLRAETPCVTIFGKSWRFQAIEALRISPEENLVLIEDSVRYLRAHVDEVVYDAEHFFDGYKDDPAYALASLEAAVRGGASYLALCDTNGGALPHEIDAAVAHTLREVTGAGIGIHTHNDAELAVANTLAAVRAGATMVQGTVNGYGERCGNANLISIVPALCLKMNLPCVTAEQLKRLRHVARTVDEISNRTPWASQPYVGRSAFAHKGGMHVDAVKKNSRTYEHIDPEQVGNHRRILLSDLSGRANVELKAKELGVELDPKSPETRKILEKLKQLEADGYQFESAGASFKLFAMQSLGRLPAFFTLRDVEVQIAFGESGGESDAAVTRVRIEIGVGDEVAYSSAKGQGPVHAMDLALRGVIDRFYPQLQAVRLVDYKVRVLSSSDGSLVIGEDTRPPRPVGEAVGGPAQREVRSAHEPVSGTSSVVRVLIQSSDGSEVWGTVGVSPNIIQASWNALVDALVYKLVKDNVDPYVTPSAREGRTSQPTVDPRG